MINMRKVYIVKIHHVFKTSERAGAGGMFQIITAIAVLDNEEEKNLIVDCGKHYYNNNEAMIDIKNDNNELDFTDAIAEDDD